MTRRLAPMPAELLAAAEQVYRENHYNMARGFPPATAYVLPANLRPEPDPEADVEPRPAAAPAAAPEDRLFGAPVIWSDAGHLGLCYGVPR